MSPNAEVQEDTRSAELVFALVAPIGLDYEQVAENIKSQLSEFGYSAEIIKLSSQIEPLCKIFSIDCAIDHSTEARRIQTHIKAANALCQNYTETADQSEKNALLALAGANEIAAARSKEASAKKIDRPPMLNKAHIIATLKRPEEVEQLRRIYGIGFHVIGIFGTEEERIRYLIRHKHLDEQDARRLVDIDEDDNEDGGQRTGDAYHLADVFVDVGGNDVWKREIGRYLDLIFSHPYKTPTKEEQAMFMAYAASLRSAQFGRQVGAAIASEDGDLMAIGCNEVPKPGGGQYWYKDNPDERDHERGTDSNDEEKTLILKQIIDTLPDELKKDPLIEQRMRKTSLFSITEYGRATHAEMEALLSCARRGISTKGSILFTTTFPCHNCARHIIGAGIRRVVYIEPYPKSKASALHSDAIDLQDESRTHCDPIKVPFVPFVGISPRKYAEIFTVNPMYGKKIDRKLKGSGSAINWQRRRTGLRLAMLPLSYIDRESLAASKLANTVKRSMQQHEGATMGGTHVDGGTEQKS
ncbi:MAG: anti-phage dCTP deaminase [Acidobacteriota bacterium]